MAGSVARNVDESAYRGFGTSTWARNLVGEDDADVSNGEHLIQALCFPGLRLRADSGGRCSVLSGSLFTSSMILAYARVVDCSPVHGTACGVSWSVWK